METALMEYLLNALWQVPVLAAGGWLLLRVTKAGPAAQHYVWLAVLAAAVLLPLRGTGVSATLEMTVAPDTRAAEEKDSAAEVATTATPDATTHAPASPVMAARSRMAQRFPAHVRMVSVSPALAHALATTYVAMLLLGLRRIVYAWRSASELARRSSDVPLPAQSMLRRRLEQLHASGSTLARLRVRVRQSHEVMSPVVVGARTPVLILPHGFARSSDAEVTAALCHELAHVQRRDYLLNLVCEVVSLPVVWHPATVWVQQRIRRTREMICDAMAARQMCSEREYARCLLTMAQRVLGEGCEQRAHALGLFGNNILEERVMRLMESRQGMSVKARVARVGCGAAGMAAAVVMACMFHVTPTMAAPKQADAGRDALLLAQIAAPELPMTKGPQLPEAPAVLPQKPSAQGPVRGTEKQEGASSALPENKRDNAEARSEHREMRLGRDELGFDPEELKKQMAEVQATINSPEFRKQMEEVQRQAKELAEHNKELAKELQKELRSDKFRKEMEEARKQADKAMGEDFKARTEELKREMAKLQEQLRSGEFREGMEKAKQALEEMRKERTKLHPNE